MDETFWQEVLSGINDKAPIDIDQNLFPDAEADQPNSRITAPQPPVAPSRALFPKKDPGASYIGVRVVTPLDHPAIMATRLAAIALERQVVPIILTTLPYSGLERFGIRTERLIGSEEDMSAAEQEVAAFWDLSIIIDAIDVEKLG